VHPNPVEDDVEQAGARFRKDGCDGVIGLGGGSALDVAKAVAVRVTHDGPLSRYEAQTGGYKLITGPVPPVIAIPTTAGTGSEVGRSAVITIPALGRKIVIFSPLLMPKRAIEDPELTVSLPPLLTASTGMDAFTHNLESLTCPVFHPICDAVALGGLELVIKYLERAVKNGLDLEARGNMMIAASMGAMAFQKDLGAAHSLAHPLSAEYGMQHGMANAVCLPAVMRFNREAAAKEYARVAALFGVNTHGMADIDAADRAIEAVIGLNQRIGIPARLRDCGIPEEGLEKLADKALEDSCHLTNPRPCTREDLLRLYRESW
nr:iron-containing alcohol dehydrogenase [bacterium]